MNPNVEIMNEYEREEHYRSPAYRLQGSFPAMPIPGDVTYRYAIQAANMQENTLIFYTY